MRARLAGVTDPLERLRVLVVAHLEALHGDSRPLVTVGLIQFITPVLQLAVGVLVLGDHVSGALWVGFGIVWLALVLLTVDSLRQARANHRDLRASEPEAPEPCP